MKKNKILITGTKGFIGKNLFNKLKNSYDILEINEDIFESNEWDFNLKKILNDFKPSVVFHVGACSNTLETDVNYIFKVNFEFTKILSDWVKNNNKKIIYSSSASNYGVNKKHPSNLYGWSKYSAEQYIISNGGVSLRYFNVYGPGEESKGNMSSIIYQIIKHIKKNNSKFKIFPKKPKRDFVFIEDVVQANILSDEIYEKIKGNYYDVGFGKPKSFEYILDILKVNFEYSKPNEIPNGYQYYTCSDKKKWLPGWSPKYSLKKGIKKYLENI